MPEAISASRMEEGPTSGTTTDAGLVRAPHQRGARVGHRRAARFRHQPAVLAGEQRREQRLDIARVLVELMQGNLLQRHGMADRLEEARARTWRSPR